MTPKLTGTMLEETQLRNLQSLWCEVEIGKPIEAMAAAMAMTIFEREVSSSPEDMASIEDMIRENLGRLEDQLSPAEFHRANALCDYVKASANKLLMDRVRDNIARRLLED